MRSRTDGAIAAATSIQQQPGPVAGLMAAVLTTLDAGGTVFTCGNGGSAAEALHLAEELIGSYRDHDRPAYRAVCLSADPTALTCIANDFGYEAVFERQIVALGRPGDLLIGLSTSGNSVNVVRALDAARAAGLQTASLLGGSPGACAERSDHVIQVAAPDGGSVQEGHLMLVHLVCEAVERAWAVAARATD
ncbi:MAG: SIS domain-containing protein [Phycisphaerales bacterium]